MKPSHKIARALRQPRTYRLEIERLRRGAKKERLRALKHDREVPFYSLYRRRRTFSRLLARSLSQGNLEPQPYKERLAQIEKKARKIYTGSFTSEIVQSVFARLVTPHINAYLCEHVHSYQKGKSSLSAARALSDFLKQHEKDRPNKKDRGLYVLKRDISAYGESIPVGDHSKLYTLFQQSLNLNPSHPNDQWL